MIQYGLAGNEKTWLGQGTWRENDRFAKLLPTDPKTAETGLKGAYTMQVNLGDKMVAEGANINVKEIPVGGTATAVATNKKYEEIDEHGIPVISFPDDRFTFRGKWTSDDPSIVEVSEDGALKGVKTGATKIHLTTENGKVFDFDITVTGAPTEEPTPEPTEEPTEEPTQEPTEEPTQEPTEEPTEEPTQEPTQEPGDEPVEEHPGEQPDKPAKPGDEQAGASAGADEEVSGGGSNGSNGTASSAGKTMPRTGAAVLPIGLVAGAFIAAGVALLVAARRRA
ncbi:hypothetical protein HMPREF3087_05855 [Brevibacterium sp. HMSC22B09]|nr:hypothetical protein HMPREF3087_05855 [Brevibacterium sp. HMSC22B09]